MRLNYDVLGNHIRLIDTRNTELVTEQVLGINIDKFFMPSVANVIGTDLSKYKLITKGKFACNPMHVGRDERLPVALYTEETPAIVSPAYFMFEIVDSSVLNEEYLMMWFRRPEFDRFCWLRTDGSVRGGITWDDICRMEVPVPPMDEQMEIVNSYKAITDRIALKKQINDNLEEQMQLYFKNMFVDFAYSDSEKKQSPCGEIPVDFSYHKLGEFVSFSQGTQVPVEEQFLENELPADKRIRFIRIVDYTTNQRETPRFINITSKQCRCSEDDVTMVRYGNIGLVGRRISGVIANNIFKIMPAEPLTNDFLFYFLRQPSIYEFIVASCGGSAMPSIKHSTVADLEFVLPTQELIKKFSKIAKQAEMTIQSNLKEMVLLQNEKDLFLAALLKRG